MPWYTTTSIGYTWSWAALVFMEPARYLFSFNTALLLRTGVELVPFPHVDAVERAVATQVGQAFLPAGVAFQPLQATSSPVSLRLVIC